MRIDVVLFIITVLGSVVFLVFFYGAGRWRQELKTLRSKMEQARLPLQPNHYDPQELCGLPEPVQCYFRKVLTKGQDLVSEASIAHSGTFNMSQTGEQWKVFTSAQHVITSRPGFVWDARISMLPGGKVFVCDAYVAGKGVLRAKIGGFLKVMEQHGTPELAHGELMRFLAEGVWYPTALLPSQHVKWEEAGHSRARAILTDGSSTVELDFEFDEQGLIHAVYSDGRYREVDGIQVATPWGGRFWNYERRHGMLIPLEAEVAWILPEGPKTYWRGRIDHLEYGCAASTDE